MFVQAAKVKDGFLKERREPQRNKMKDVEGGSRLQKGRERYFRILLSGYLLCFRDTAASLHAWKIRDVSAQM